jgi:cell pole-organizing protein PopZ
MPEQNLSAEVARMLVATNEPAPAPEPQRGDQSSIADVVRDLLRPMIQRWLDENLQALAERNIGTEVTDAIRGSADADPPSFAETVVWLTQRHNDR